MNDREERYFFLLGKVPGGSDAFNKYITGETLLSWEIGCTLAALLVLDVVIPLAIMERFHPLLGGAVMCAMPLITLHWAIDRIYPAIRERVTRNEFATLAFLTAVTLQSQMSTWPANIRRLIRKRTLVDTFLTWRMGLGVAVGLLCTVGTPFVLARHSSWVGGIAIATFWVGVLMEYVVIQQLYPAMRNRATVRIMEADRLRALLAEAHAQDDRSHTP